MYDEERGNPIFENVNTYKENIFNNPPFSFSSPTGNSFSNNDTTTLGGSTTDNSIRGENKSNAKTSDLGRWRTGARKVLASIVVIRGSKLPRGGRTKVREAVKRAFDANDNVRGEEEAIASAEGFVFPWKRVMADDQELRALNFDLPTLVERRQNAPGRKESRLNEDRVNTLHSQDNKNVRDLRIIAGKGIPVHVQEGFEPNGKPPPLRPKYRRVSKPVNKTLAKWQEKGLGVIVTTEAALQVPGVHFNHLNHGLKVDDPAGRVLCDCSYGEPGSDNLTNPITKKMVKEEWGPILHPKIVEIIRMIGRVAAVHGWDKITLWKMDLRGAFTLMDFDPKDVRLLAFELDNESTYFPIAGMFGLTGLPFAFNTLSRPLEAEVNWLICGEVVIYVDDLIGCSPIVEAENDMELAAEAIRRLAGPNAVADDKTVSGRSLPMIGWQCDLDGGNPDRGEGTVGLSQKNADKALYTFLKVDEDEPIAMADLETMASLASRYALICRYMKPLVGQLYKEFVGRRGRARKAERVMVSSKTKMCIRRWRAFLALTICDQPVHGRPMRDFCEKRIQFVIEYDASLVGMGIRIFAVEGDEESPTERLLTVTGYDTPFDLQRQSRYQNTMEFMAATIGICILAREGVRNAGVRMRGDSKSSLSWATNEKFKCGPSEGTATLFLMACELTNISVEDSEFLRGVDNTECDKLSRGQSPGDLGYPAHATREIRRGGTLARLIELCDPLQELTKEEQWANLHSEMLAGIKATLALQD